MVNYLEDSSRSYNSYIGKLSPQFLNNMYKAEHRIFYDYPEFRFLNEEIKNCIFEMNYKVDKNVLSRKIQGKRSLYIRLKALVMKAFRAGKGQKEVPKESSREIDRNSIAEA